MLPFSLWLLPLMLASFIAPGAVAARRLRLRPGERLSVVVALSLLGMFLCWWSLWIAGVPAVWCSGATAGTCGLMAVVGWRDIRRLFAEPVVRWQAAGFAAVAAHALLLHAAVFCYSGGLWGGDWCNHFSQAVFFGLDGDPRPNLFPSGDAITARPPLQNIVAAHFWRLGSLSYADYQVIMTLLSSLACLPVLLLADRLAVRTASGRQAAAVLATAAALTLPAFAQNAVYPWTKLLAAFFVVLGLLFWADGVGRASRPRRLLAAGLLAGGVLVHYSAAVYAVALAGFELAAVAGGLVSRRPLPLVCHAVVRNGQAALVAAAVFAPWLVWAVVMFGPSGTFATNTAVVDAAVYTPAENLLKAVLNVRDTLVPSALRGGTDLTAMLGQQGNWLGRIRDGWFLPYQVNFPAALGVVGWTAAAVAAAVAVRRHCRRTRLFWAAVVSASFLLGVAAHGGRDHNGLAQICCHPLMLLGTGLLAGMLPRLARGLQPLVVAGMAIDYLFGTLLQATVQSWRFGIAPPPGGAESNTAGLSLCATSNLLNKFDLGVVFLADRLDRGGVAVVVLLTAAALLATAGLFMAARVLWRLGPSGLRHRGGSRPG